MNAEIMNEDDENYCRIAYSFPKQVIFLDIETTGFKYYDYITCIGWIYGGKYHYWLQGLNQRKFINTFKQAKLLVTFNGRSFDCKFLNKAFHTKIFTAKAHLDLMWMCKRLGFREGQKNIEDIAGFKRHPALDGLNGRFAAESWDAFMNGENSRLKLLIAYNFYDVLGMTHILDWCAHKVSDSQKYFRYDDEKLMRKIVLPTSDECEKIRVYVQRKHSKNAGSKFL